MPSSVPSPELLLERVRCVTALARVLAREHASGEDVAQDALLHSLQRGEPDSEPMPGWLARKVRSLSRRARRAAGRRTRRETVAACPEAVPSAAELVERAWLQRTLVEAVVGLDEPYRSVVLLRYFEELAPREIASMRSVPVRTIQTQLSRGLAQLRARLDRKLGPGTWAVLAAPLGSHGPIQALKPVAPSQSSTPLALAAGGILVKTQIKVLAALGAAVGLGALALILSPGEGPALPRGGPAEPLPSLAAVSADDPPLRSESMSAASSARDRAPALTDPDDSPNPSSTEPIDRDRDLFGEVVDPGGRPIPGAAVSVQKQANPPPLQGSIVEPSAEAIAETSTDGEGHFRLRLEPGPQYRLLVEHPSYATARLPDRLAGEKVRVVLGAPASFHGRVLREEDHGAIPGARVVLQLRPWGFVQQMESYVAECDELGSFHVERLPAGTYDVDVECPQAPSTSPPGLDLAAGQSIEREILVPEGLKLTGHVLDASTGQPLRDAEVGSSWKFFGSVRTGMDGSFELRSFALEWREIEDVVSARAAGYATTSVSIRKGAPIPSDLRIELVPGVTAIGRILDPEGAPAAGAHVSACGRFPIVADGSSRSVDAVSVESRADGRFRLEGLSPLARHSLVVQSPGAGSLVVDFPDSESAGGEVDLGDLALFAPASLRGRVVDRTGNPIPNAWVAFEGGDGGRHRLSLGPSPDVDFFATEQRHRVDDLGRFSATDLGPGTWNLSARCAGIESVASLSVTLREGESREELELVLDVGTDENTIAGRVVGPGGEAVVGVHVQACGETLEAQSPGMNVLPDGTFRLSGLAPGTYHLETLLWPSAPQGLCPIRIDGIRPGDVGVVIELPRRAVVRGRLLSHDGTPCTTGGVQIDYGDGARGGFLAVPVDADGRFELAVPAGKHVDFVAFDPTVMKEGRVRQIAAGTEDVLIRLDP